MKRKTAALLVLLIMAGFIQGCWNYREVDSLNIVAGVAIDRGQEGYKYHLTIDIADTSNAGKDKPVVSTLIETEGDTMFDAVRNAVKKTGLRIYWPNCQIVVISQEIADESIQPIVDYFMRDAEPRITMELFVSQEKTAKEIMQQQATTMSITSFEIDKMYELTELYEPVTVYLQLHEIYNVLADKGRALTLPTLKLVENVGSKTAALSGTAVFDRDRLKGFINDEDSKYLLFLMDRIKGGVLTVKAATDNTIAALEIFGNKTTITPITENGEIRFSIHTETQTAVNELDTTMDYLEVDSVEQLQALAETQLKDNIERVIKIVQEQFGKDVFGFGDALHRSDPVAWNSVSQNWDEVFKNLKFDVSCKVIVRNAVSIQSPVKVGR